MKRPRARRSGPRCSIDLGAVGALGPLQLAGAPVGLMVETGAGWAPLNARATNFVSLFDGAPPAGGFYRLAGLLSSARRPKPVGRYCSLWCSFHVCVCWCKCVCWLGLLGVDKTQQLFRSHQAPPSAHRSLLCLGPSLAPGGA